MITFPTDVPDLQAPIQSGVECDFTRAAIESGQVDKAAANLQWLSETAAKARQFQGQLSFKVSGYEIDPRDLDTIPEVCAFFVALTAKWPYWLHYFPVGDESLITIFMMHQAHWAAEAGEDVIDDSVRSHRTGVLLKILATGLADLHKQHGFSELEFESLKVRWFARIEGMAKEASRNE